MTTNTQDMRAVVHTIARRARAASAHLATTSSAVRTDAIERIATALRHDAPRILAANAEDVADARDAVARGDMTEALLHRLVLDPKKLDHMVMSVRAVAALDDPIGRTLACTRLDHGLELAKVAVPLGVMVAIFEARPDAVTQIAALALKSGNAVILKGGREATRSTHALVQCMRAALATTDIPVDVIASVDGRDAIDVLLNMDGDIDLIVPRGSNALVRSIQSRTRIPVLGHADGICHVYVDASADRDMAVRITVDSKVQYPAACNAAETLLIDASAVTTHLPAIAAALADEDVEVRVCPRSRAALDALIASNPTVASHVVDATDADWRTEYGARIIACKMVDGVRDAVDHIATYGSHHTDAIVAADRGAADYFLSHVDSAGVYHNASTRFADGFRYGFGAEVGVSTSKLHARGPVGVDGLTTYKYQLRGEGQIVSDYAGSTRDGTPGRPYLHERCT